MNETPKAKTWAVPFFILMILFIGLPKAVVDLVQSNIRIHVEKTRQENLEALTQSVRENSLQTAKLKHEIELSQLMLSNLREIKQLTLFQVFFHGLILIGLIRSVLKQKEKSTTL